jgi:hypothetical protein
MTMSAVSTLHPVAIQFKGGFAVAEPDHLTNMGNGDTLEINSTDGTFRIEFEPWPFAQPPNPKKEVTTSDPLTFQNHGPDSLPFKFDCYITPYVTGKEVGYPGASGGNGNVKPPGK